jgi:Na+/glutamate symporter
MWMMTQTWGCIPELSPTCMDMTNASSTYLGIIIGAIIGAIISWWIFNRQEKTSVKQDYTLNRIEHLEKYNEKLLEKILDLNRKIDSLLEDKV